MNTVLLIVHLFVTLALIGVVLVQRSEGGGLGVGTSQGMGAFMSGRGAANFLTRATAVLATVFMLLSLALALLNKGGGVSGGNSLLVPIAPPAANAPATPAVPGAAPTANGQPAAPATPPGPAVPTN